MHKREIVTKVSDIGLPKKYSIKEHGITQSMLKAFPTCRQRFLFMVNGWRQVDDGRFAVFGIICHYIMEHIYKSKVKPSRIKLRNMIKNCVKEIKKDLSEFALTDLAKNMAMAEILMFHYWDYYPKDFKRKYTSVEGEFCVELGGFKLRGKKDLRFKAKDGEVMQEHKTKGRIEEDMLIQTLAFDFQNLFYIIAQTLEDDVKIPRVLYNIIRNPGLKQGKAESFKEYMTRIEDDVLSRPDFYYIRYEIPYSEQNKKRFKKQLVTKLMEAQKFLDGGLPVYRNEDACKMPFRCPYLGACSSGTMAGYKVVNDLFPELDTFSFNPKK